MHARLANLITSENGKCGQRSFSDVMKGAKVADESFIEIHFTRLSFQVFELLRLN